VFDVQPLHVAVGVTSKNSPKMVFAVHIEDTRFIRSSFNFPPIFCSTSGRANAMVCSKRMILLICTVTVNSQFNITTFEQEL
jgi:hypothetical protein